MAELPRPLRPFTALAVTMAMASLWLHPGLDRPVFVGFAIALLWPALMLPGPVPWPGWARAWDSVVLLALGPALASWLLAPPQRMPSLVALIILVLLRCAYNPGGARQQRVMIGLAGVLVMLTSQATESPLFALLAAPFLVCAVGALVWSEVGLGREASSNPPPGQPLDPVMTSHRLWLVPLGLSLVAMMCGGVLFLLFPRAGLAHQRRSVTDIDPALTGLANRVELGSYQRLLEDPTEAVRLTWLSSPQGGGVYLRGSALEELTHLGPQWIWSRTIKSTMVACTPGEMTPLRGTEVPSDAVRQRIEMLDPALRTIFALPWPVAVQGPTRSLIHESGDRWRMRHVEERWPVYEVWSVPGQAPDTLAVKARLSDHLQLPEDLCARVREFLVSEHIVSMADLPEQRAESIARHLRSTHRHSLDLSEIRRDNPLEDFLFHPRAGNCEYFASAMAVMCRAVGIPSRLVTGFQGGEPTREGGRLFRRSDSHAWVEIWIPERGWVMMDPTPPEPLVARTDLGLWSGITGMAGQVASQWREHVVQYEGAWHRRFLGWTSGRLDRLVGFVSGESGVFHRFQAKFQRNLRERPSLWGFFALIVLLNLIAWRLERHFRMHGLPWHRRRPSDPHEILVSRIARALVAHPRPRRPGETVARYLTSLRDTDGPSLPAAGLERLIDSYHAWRFDPCEESLTAQSLLRQAQVLRTELA
ncbi:DUF3488 domain-containing protein [Candidatus Sumerlaeota bacterium]|nr:DUF3488 domain-containing protein [Candidatus Sumerlaeota bacterium]